MVKGPTTRKPRPPVNKDGTPRRPPGKAPSPSDVRAERLVLRVHPDLMEILTVRARERGVTRSAYVEQLLVGWVKLDPRTRRIDAIGKYVPDAPDPTQVRLRSPLSYANRWSKFSTASRLLLSAEPPQEWLENEELGFATADEARLYHNQQSDDDEPPSPPFMPRRR